jgi:hypothetical protein
VAGKLTSPCTEKTPPLLFQRKTRATAARHDCKHDTSIIEDFNPSDNFSVAALPDNARAQNVTPKEYESMVIRNMNVGMHICVQRENMCGAEKKTEARMKTRKDQKRHAFV